MKGNLTRVGRPNPPIRLVERFCLRELKKLGDSLLRERASLD